MGYLLLLVFILIITLFEINVIKNNFNKNYYDFENSLHRLDMVNVLYLIELKLGKWHKLTKNHILCTDPQEMQEIENRIITKRNEVYDDLNDYRKSCVLKDSSVTLVDAFEEKVRNFESYNKEVLFFSKINNKSEALLLSNTKSLKAFILAENALNTIINKHIEVSISDKKKSLDIYNKSLQIFSFTIKFIIILGIVVCVISFVLAFVSIKIISKQYNSLKNKETELINQNKALIKQEQELQEKNEQLIKKSEELEFANRELIIINKSLRELDSMKSNFISTVSHELRTPLTSIKGSLGLVLNDVVGNVDGESKTFLNISYRNTDRLIRLINELLDISKIESGNISLHKVEFNLKDTIRDSIEGICSFAVEQKVKIYTNIKDDISIYADRDRIEQVMYNLLSNAIKFSSGNEEKQGEITISASVREDNILVTVKDNGIGIPKDKQDLIFEKFTQVDNTSTRNEEGTGLGLAICKALIEEHQGKIWVESNYGEGATFSFTIASKETQVLCDKFSRTLG